MKKSKVIEIKNEALVLEHYCRLKNEQKDLETVIKLHREQILREIKPGKYGEYELSISSTVMEGLKWSEAKKVLPVEVLKLLLPFVYETESQRVNVKRGFK